MPPAFRLHTAAVPSLAFPLPPWAFFATPASASAASTQPSVRPCTVGGLPAKCGALQVPEDRASGNGCMITVGFVVTPAAMASDRLPDPVVYFAGGP